MSPSKRSKSAVAVCAFVSLLFALTISAAGQHRPVNVPEEYRVTPFGYMHPSCVVHLGEGDTVGEDTFLHHADGTTEPIPVCSYPRYSKKGEVAETVKSVPIPTISWAWLEASAAFPNINLGESYSIWTVPPSPTSHDGQVLYLFPGVGNILQPVLGWNADFSNSWGIASWECCLNNSSLESKPIQVNSGDRISGTVVQGCSWGTGSCSTWNITTTDQDTGQSTTENNAPLAGQQNNAVEGVLEVYSIAQCSDYPPNGEIIFNSWFYDYNGNPVTPNWGTGVDTSDSPQCNYSAHATATQVTLTYGSAQFPTSCGDMTSGESLYPGQSLNSCDSRFTLTMQNDGNLVLYQGNTALWSTGTYGTTGQQAIMQSDGNFVLYNPMGALWASGTNGNAGAHLALQNDGNLVVYNASNSPLWASNTVAGSGGTSSCWAAWSSSSVYTAGAQVSYKGENYQAAYWTRGNNPATSSGPRGSGKPWIPEGACH